MRHDIGDIPIYAHGHDRGPGYESWDSLMLAAMPIPICPSVRKEMGFSTPCCYIFTSGTTGKIYGEYICLLLLNNVFIIHVYGLYC